MTDKLEINPQILVQIIGEKEIELLLLRANLARAQAKIAELEQPKEPAPVS